MMKLCLWIVSVASIVLCIQARTIIINDLFKLCPDSSTLSNDETTISVNEGKPCIISQDNLHVTGQYNNSTSTVVNCIQNASNGYSGRAIVFHNVRNILLEHLEFHNCQGNLPANVTISNEYYHFMHYQSGLLYFSNCSNVIIQNVTFIYDSGIMIALVNTDAVVMEVIMDGSCMHTCNCSSNEIRSMPTSGVLIYYHGNPHANEPRSVNITELTATHNKDCSYIESGCHYYNSDLKNLTDVPHPHPLLGLAAVTIIFAQQNFHAQVDIKLSKISSNFGAMSSGMLLLYLYAHRFSNVHLDQVEFERNVLMIRKSETCVGSALQVGIFHVLITRSIQSKNWMALVMSNSNVSNHNGTAIRIATRENPNSIKIRFYKVKFENNYHDTFFSGVCIVAEGTYVSSTSITQLQIIFDLVTARNNSVQHLPFKTKSALKVPLTSSGVFVFTNLDTVIIKGQETQITDCSNDIKYSYSNNKASVFVGIGTDFKLVNNLCFFNNMATSGAAFYLSSFSHLFIYNNASINFTKNNASTVGGAIATTPIGNSGTMCLIQLPHKLHYAMTFRNNMAELGGSAMYGSPLYQCQQIAVGKSINMTQEYFSSSRFMINDSWDCDQHSQVQGIPWKVKCCDNRCNTTQKVYPGSKIFFKIKVVDMVDNPTSSRVYIYLKNSNYNVQHSNIYYKLRSINCKSAGAHGRNSTSSSACQNFSLNIYSTETGQTDLELATETTNPTLLLKLEIEPCPIGFKLVKSKGKGRCACSNFINSVQKYTHIGAISCNIGDEKIIRNNTDYFWMGQIGENTLAFSEICPFGHCNSLTEFYVNRPDTLCHGNRHGKICGSCKEGYSTAFGVNTCHKCSSLWLLSILAYAALGIVLVVVMYALQLTLDKGTVGGVIFYANVYMLGILYLKNLDYNEKSLSATYVVFVNLSVNFKVCFYDGMSELTKVGLKLIFPFYIWLLVGIIVIASRCSTKISRFTSKRSVQVLITLIHLSMARLLVTVLEIASFAILRTEKRNYNGTDHKTEVVWLTSGDVLYGKTFGHICLLIVAIATMLFILIPYWLITSLAPCCYGSYIISRLKPVIDSIYAPYKTSKRYWFGVRQTLLVFFYICFGVSIGENRVEELGTIQTWILATFMVLQLLLRPFRNPWVHFIDSFYMILLTAMAYVGLDILKTKHRHIIWTTLQALSLLGLAMLICIIIYHVLLVLDLVSSCTNKWTLLKCRIKRRFLVNEDLSATVQRSEEYMSIVGSNNRRSNSNRLRESLLSDRYFPFTS